MSAKWLPVLGYEGIYEVSDDGRVRGGRFDREMKLRHDSHGYMVVCLSKNSTQVVRKVHQLVLEAFVGPRPTEEHQVAHWNGVRSDNRLSNLRWATPAENAYDRKRTGTNLAGERNPSARLTEQEVREIREQISRGRRSLLIAADFGISQGMVRHIARRAAWRHVA